VIVYALVTGDHLLNVVSGAHTAANRGVVSRIIETISGGTGEPRPSRYACSSCPIRAIRSTRYPKEVSVE
jgi:hypothetical protein